LKFTLEIGTRVIDNHTSMNATCSAECVIHYTTSWMGARIGIHTSIIMNIRMDIMITTSTRLNSVVTASIGIDSVGIRDTISISTGHTT